MQWTAYLYYDDAPQRASVKECPFARLLWWIGLLVLPAIGMVDEYVVTIPLDLRADIAIAIGLCEISVLFSRKSLGRRIVLALLAPCLVVAEIAAIGIASLSSSGFEGIH